MSSDDILKEIQNSAEKIQNNTFKTQKRYRKRSLSGNNSKSIAIDAFGNPFRALDEEDKTTVISITLPASLINILDKKREKIPRSRFLREMIEYCLDLEMK